MPLAPEQGPLANLILWWKITGITHSILRNYFAQEQVPDNLENVDCKEKKVEALDLINMILWGHGCSQNFPFLAVPLPSPISF